MKRESWQTFADVTVRGRIGRDVELKETQNGHTIAQTTIAVNRGKKGAEKTLWLTIKGFNNNAHAMKWLTKGQLVTVVGQLDVSQWTDKTGTAKERMEVLVSSVDTDSEPAAKAVDFDDVP